MGVVCFEVARVKADLESLPAYLALRATFWGGVKAFRGTTRERMTVRDTFIVVCVATAWVWLTVLAY